MNKGIKNYCKYLTIRVKKAGIVNINLNKEDNNLHLDIPLVKTFGYRPIKIKLLYTQSEKNILTEFGYGVKLNLYTNLKISNDKNTITMTNCDGAESIFARVGTSNVYECKKLLSKITVSYDSYTQAINNCKLEDNNGNMMDFNGLSNYPYYIKKANGDTYTIDSLSTINKITNGKGQIITFVKSNGLVNEIIVSKNEKNIYTIRLSYVNKYLNGVQLYDSDGNCLNSATYEMNTNEFLLIKDNLSNYRMKFYFNNDGKIIKYKDGFDELLSSGKETFIEYFNYHTIITGFNNTKMHYYFDDNDLPIAEIDNKGRAISYEYEYDKENNIVRKCWESSLIENSKNNKFITNLIKNGYFDDNTENWSIDNVNNASIVQDDSNDFVDLLGDKTLKVFSTSNEKTTISQIINESGIAYDSITLSFWIKYQNSEEIKNDVLAKITLLSEGKTICRETINIKSSYGDFWKLKTVTCNPEKSYDSILVEFVISDDALCMLDAIQVLKIPLNNFYKYDDNGNVTENLINNSANNAKYTYNDSCPNNLLKQSYGSDSSLYNFEYDENGNILRVQTSYETVINNEYDENNNIIKTNVSTGGKFIETESTYNNSDPLVSSTKDDAGNVIRYIYDETYGRLKEIISATGVKTSYSYDYFGNLLKVILSKDDKQSSVEYTYNNDKLTSAKTNNGEIYFFDYDLEEHLIKVSIGKTKTSAKTLLSYEYDYENGVSMDRVKSQSFGESGDTFEFEYSEDKLKNVYFIDRENKKTLYYSYEYNEVGLLNKYVDNKNEQSYIYKYNDSYNLEEIIDQNNNKMIFGFDNLGQVINKIFYINNEVLVVSMDPQYRSRGISPEAVYNTIQTTTAYKSCFFNEHVYDESSKKYKSEKSKKLVSYDSNKQVYGQPTEPCIGNDLEVVKEGLISCIDYENNTSRLAYDVNTFQRYPNSCESVAFWFKPSESNIGKYLISTSYEPKGRGFIGAYINEDNKVVLKLIDDNGEEYSVIETESTIRINEWNFFALTWFNRHDEIGYANVCTYEVFLNNEYKLYKKTDPRIYIYLGLSSTIHFGCNYDGTSQVDKFNGKITGLLLSNGQYLKAIDVIKYYNLTREYIVESSTIDESLQVVESCGTNVYTFDKDFLNEYTLIPLNNSVKSIDQCLSPKFMSTRVTADFDRDRTFNFNSITKRYSYVADGTELIYDFNLKNSGFIGMKVYINGNHSKQYLVQNIDSNGNDLGVYRNENGSIYLKLGSEIKNTGLIINNNKWTFLGLTWSKIINSDSEKTISYMIRIMVDNLKYDITINSQFELGNLLSSIGRTKETETVLTAQSEQIEITNCAYGQIEMLCIKDAYLSFDSMNYVKEQLTINTYSCLYDQFGRKVKSLVVKDGNVQQSSKYYYLYRSNDSSRTTNKISKQHTYNKYNQLISTIILDYYSDNNIKSRIYNGNKTNFEYDYRNYLSKEIGDQVNNIYEYDENGNVIKKIDKLNNTELLFEYDNDINSLWKDRLIKVGNLSIEYDDKYIGVPVAIVNNNSTLVNFEWEGKRLINIQNHLDGLNINYKYNDKGIRIKKIVNELEHNYYYEFNQLIAEVYGNVKKFFIYGSDGNITAFRLIKDGKDETYNYLIDPLSTIIGLTDANGNLVVKYDYDAWGNCTISGNLAATIGVENPIRYKTYYFDDETGYYYINSRYYNPKWMRFISNDTNMPNGKPNEYNNLYSYCDNSPVERRDATGNFWNIVAGAVIGAVVNVAVTCISAAIKNEPVSLCDVIVSGLAGAASGALAATGLGVAAQCVGNAIINTATNVYDASKDGDGVSSDELIDSVVNGVISGVASGFIGGKGFKHKSGNVVKMDNLYKKTLQELREQVIKWDVFEEVAHHVGNEIMKEVGITSLRFTIASTFNAVYNEFKDDVKNWISNFFE